MDGSIYRSPDIFSGCEGMFLKKKAAIAACSNGFPVSRRVQVERLVRFLRKIGLETVVSTCLYQRDGTPFGGSPKERAQQLMSFYKDPEVGMIFDISGGDAANGILPYLDFDLIRESRTVFWGYSDLTTILNAIYSETGQPSVLYQARHLLCEEREKDKEEGASGQELWQERAFQDLIFGRKTDLLEFSYQFINKNSMEGRILGGNMRCFLKLAGTKFWPAMEDKILLLEASGGEAAQMASCLAQLRQIGVFEQIRGILLGTFLSMEENSCRPSIEELVMEYTEGKIPVARTAQIGHRKDSHGVLIGARVSL